MTRPFTVIDCDQRSDAWFAARCGRLTGSRAVDAFATLKTGAFTAQRKNLRVALALERITGIPQEDRGSSKAMRDGITRESSNRFAYECLTGELVSQCGFLADDELPIGVSLDGYLGDFEGIIECKSPLAATHLETLTGYRAWQKQRDSLTTDIDRIAFQLNKGDLQVIDVEYRWQIRHAMYCSGAAWCDFVSYHPAFPVGQQLIVIRVTREDCALDQYESMVRAFLDEVESDVQQIMEAA